MKTWLTTREAEERERRLSGDLEQLRSQQQQSHGTLHTRIDAMLERRTQASMYRLLGLLGNRVGSRNRETHSIGASREPRVNFNEHPDRRRTYGFTRGRGNSSSNVTGNNRPKDPTNLRGSSTGNRPASNERPMRDENATGRSDSTNWNHSNQGRYRSSDSNSRETPEP